MDKKKNFLSKKIAVLRGWIQAAATLLTNIHIPNLWKGKIYQGSVKNVCVPGLNCYSCPAATGACPIGAFQAVVGSSGFKFSYYITGFFILLGVTLGRFICGFLCPFGWFQDLLHKIPGKKFSTARLKPLRYLKYIILIIFVILLPMLVTNSIGMGDPFFCKYICPQGVLEGAIPLALGNAAIRSALGKLFSFKCLILITVIRSAPGANLCQAWQGFYFQTPSLIVGQMPVEYIHFVFCQFVDVFLYFLFSEPVAADVKHKSAPGKLGFVGDVGTGNRPVDAFLFLAVFYFGGKHLQ